MIDAFALQHRKMSHKFPACLVPQAPRPFSKGFVLDFPPAHGYKENLTENQGWECNKATR